MKIVAKPIDIIVSTNLEGKMLPIKFRLKAEDESYSVFNIDEIYYSTYEKGFGSPFVIYKCGINLNGVSKIIELKFEISTMKWQLYRI